VNTTRWSALWSLARWWTELVVWERWLPGMIGCQRSVANLSSRAEVSTPRVLCTSGIYVARLSNSSLATKWTSCKHVATICLRVTLPSTIALVDAQWLWRSHKNYGVGKFLESAWNFLKFCLHVPISGIRGIGLTLRWLKTLSGVVQDQIYQPVIEIHLRCIFTMVADMTEVQCVISDW